jgi:hypothetical protein
MREWLETHPSGLKVDFKAHYPTLPKDQIALSIHAFALLVASQLVALQHYTALSKALVRRSHFRCISVPDQSRCLANRKGSDTRAERAHEHFTSTLVITASHFHSGLFLTTWT